MCEAMELIPQNKDYAYVNKATLTSTNKVHS